MKKIFLRFSVFKKSNFYLKKKCQLEPNFLHFPNLLEVKMFSIFLVFQSQLSKQPLLVTEDLVKVWLLFYHHLRVRIPQQR
jgi:hypothetical protein